MTDEIKDYAADATITPAGNRKKRGQVSKDTDVIVENVPVPEPKPGEEPYLDEKTRLEIQMGAATLRATQERLKKAE